MRTLFITLLLNFVVIPQVAAESIFSEREEVTITKKDETFVASFFGGDENKAKTAKWGKFKKLEEYGHSSTPTYSESNTYDPAEAAAAQDYLRSKDPFSNDNRLENVQNVLTPPESSQIGY